MAHIDRRGRSSSTPWGWIAFGVGLAVCVGVGGVVGVMLGQDDGANDADAERVAALALDTRGLSEDALGLSRAIEEAIAREELEGEAESLRAELSRLDARAARIRARAEAEADAAQDREIAAAVNRGLGEISNTVAVFEHDVVARLGSVVDDAASPALPVQGVPPDPAIEEALAEVTATLEEQDETLTALADDLEEADGAADSSLAGVDDAEEADLVSGSFDSALMPPDQTLEISYELGDLEAEVDGSGAEPAEATIASSATGRLTVVNTGSGPTGRAALPSFHLVLYWKEADVPDTVAGGEVDADPSTEEEAGESEANPEAGGPCVYEIEGDRYCALTRFALYDEAGLGEGAGSAEVPDPGEEVSVGAPQPEAALVVDRRHADSVADFVGSHPPDLVEVLAGGESESFRPACVAPTAGEEEAGSAGEAEGSPSDADESTLGLIAADGEVIFEAEDTSESLRMNGEGEPEVPQCYTLLDESSAPDQG